MHNSYHDYPVYTVTGLAICFPRPRIAVRCCFGIRDCCKFSAPLQAPGLGKNSLLRNKTREIFNNFNQSYAGFIWTRSKVIIWGTFLLAGYTLLAIIDGVCSNWIKPMCGGAGLPTGGNAVSATRQAPSLPR